MMGQRQRVSPLGDDGRQFGVWTAKPLAHAIQRPSTTARI